MTEVAERPVQGTFDELGTPLRDVTFVIVDLETTGGSPATCQITEVGAVKVRAGEVLGEFQTLVNPGVSIPPFIAVLTGITDTMVATAPAVDAVLPAFLEFARGSVLVAHNAPFDVGFLRHACTATERPWPAYQTLDTARLARRVLTKDEAPDCRLSTLARIFRSPTVPEHRALADARATVHVLHALFERLGNLGVQSVEELATFTSHVDPAVRRKRHLAADLPTAPGVYVFRDGEGRPLYVGKSTNIRSRVRNYFVSSETRTRMAEMVMLAERVDAIVCATPLEAEVRELRLIAEHKPRYNRRSRFPERASWLKLTVEPFPRLSRVREVRDDGAAYLGPFSSRRQADAAMTALHEAFPIRQCTPRLSPRRLTAACALAGMGRCGAPCEGAESAQAYAVHVDGVRAAMHTTADQMVTAITGRVSRLAEMLRYEEAARHRDRLAAFLRAAARYQRLHPLAQCAQIVAAARTAHGGYEVHVFRHGRLVGADVVPPEVHPRPRVDALIATSESVARGAGPTPCATAEEMECILRWLDQPGVRLVEIDGIWSCPSRGAERHRNWFAAREGDAGGAAPFADKRRLRPVHRPARALG
ncbi:MAG: DEDD exonuclease domain-containing protein [Actinomycetes bacterium]